MVEQYVLTIVTTLVALGVPSLLIIHQLLLDNVSYCTTYKAYVMLLILFLVIFTCGINLRGYL